MLRIDPQVGSARNLDIGILRKDGTIEGSGDILYTSFPAAAIRLANERGGIGYGTNSGGFQRWSQFRIYKDEKKELRIYVVRIPLELADIEAFRDWAYTRNITMQSTAGMAWQFLRSTFRSPRVFSIDEDRIPFRKIPAGARLHAQPGFYSSVFAWDIRAAYLWALATMRVPARWIYLDGADYSAVRGKVGFARVKWHRGLASQRGKMRATYFPSEMSQQSIVTLDEIEGALSMDSRAKVGEAWIGIDCETPFASFGDIMTEARSISSFGKLVGNSLYGAFGSANPRFAVRFPSREKIILGAGTAHSLAISRAVVGRLRARFFGEIMGTNTVQINTDGVMIIPGGAMPIPGENIGEWRFMGERRNVEILSHNWYAYDDVSGERIYRTAGIANRERSSRAFAHARDQYLSQNRSWMVIR